MGFAVSEIDLLHCDLEEILGLYPQLRELVPDSFPRGKTFNITPTAMQDYSATRLSRYWHHLNLPLLLHASRHEPDTRVRSLLESVLRTFEEFIARLRNLPNLRALLRPLWEDLWTTTPQLWSIASCAYMALSFHQNSIPLLGFETPLSEGRNSPKDDITVLFNNKVTHVEIEAFHAADFTDLSDEELRCKLAARADQKAAKFSHMRAGHGGLVAIVCVVGALDVERRLHAGATPIDGRPGVSWMATRVMGVDIGGNFQFAVMPL